MLSTLAFSKTFVVKRAPQNYIVSAKGFDTASRYYYSSDGGSTFTQCNSPSMTHVIWSGSRFITETKYYSTDGANWLQLPQYATLGTGLVIKLVGGSKVVYVNTNYEVWISTNEGDTFVQKTSINSSQVPFINGSMYVVDSNTNGSVILFHNQTGTATSTFTPKVAISTDGCVSYTYFTAPGQGARFIYNKLYSVVRDSYAKVSTDNGSTWTDMTAANSPFLIPYVGSDTVAVKSASEALAAGARSSFLDFDYAKTHCTLRRTTDGGSTWTDVNVSSAPWYSGSYIINSLVWTGTKYLLIVKIWGKNMCACQSSDGLTWENLAQTFADDGDFPMCKSAVNTWTSGPPATPTNLVISNIGSTTFDITFTAPEGATSYTMIVTPTPSGTAVTYTFSEVTYSVSGLVSGTTYNVSLTASNAAGTSTAATTSVTTVSVPLAPTNLTLSNIGMNSMTITFTASAGATSYSVLATPSPSGNTVNTTITSSPYTITGLSRDTFYYIYVRAINVAGTSAAVSKSTGTLSGIVSDPTIWFYVTGDGPNNSQTFTDLSTYNRTFTPYNTTDYVNSSDVTLFGYNTIKSLANKECIKTLMPAVNTDEFTFECFYYRTTTALSSYIFAQYTGNGGTGSMVQSNNRFRCRWNGSVYDDLTQTVAQNRWYHVAMSRVGTDILVHIDGVLKITIPNSNQSVGSYNYYIGGGTLGNAQGYVAQARFTAGRSQYTSANFTVPTGPYYPLS